MNKCPKIKIMRKRLFILNSVLRWLLQGIYPNNLMQLDLEDYNTCLKKGSRNALFCDIMEHIGYFGLQFTYINVRILELDNDPNSSNI